MYLKKQVDRYVPVKEKHTRNGANMSNHWLLWWGTSVNCSEHATAQPCRHTTSEAFQALKVLCDIYIYYIKFGMLQVRENEISLRKWSLVVLRMRTLEGTLDSIYR